MVYVILCLIGLLTGRCQHSWEIRKSGRRLYLTALILNGHHLRLQLTILWLVVHQCDKLLLTCALNEYAVSSVHGLGSLFLFRVLNSFQRYITYCVTFTFWRKVRIEKLNENKMCSVRHSRHASDACSWNLHILVLTPVNWTICNGVMTKKWFRHFCIFLVLDLWPCAGK